MSNKYDDKTFSSANLAFLICAISVISTYLYITSSSIVEAPLFAAVCLGTMIAGLGVGLYLKFPIFIEPKPIEDVNENFYDNKYNRDIGWFECLYFSLFTVEPSKFASLFSGTTLRLFTKGRICKFTWENKKVKFIHRILDFLVMLLLTPMACTLTIQFLSFGWGSSVSIYVICLALLFKKHIIFYFFSINVSTLYGYKINVIYPYSTVRFRMYKYYGLAEVFTKTILITEDTFRLNTKVKEYVLHHEAGHITKSKFMIFQYMGAIFALLYLAFAPEILTQINYSSIAYTPLLLYIIYNATIGYRLNLKSELFADETAIKALGKEKVLDALKIIKESNGNSKTSFISQLFLRYVPIERRIKFVNEYPEE